MIAPITIKIVGFFGGYVILADIVTLGVIIGITILVGIAVNNVIGKAIHGFIEKYILSIIPWYRFLKESIGQFVNTSKSPFQNVALIQIYGNNSPIEVTCFITNTTVIENRKKYTAFMCTAPNPTSGWVFHVDEEFVRILDVPIDETLKSIIGCGVGSNTLLTAAQQEIK